MTLQDKDLGFALASVVRWLAHRTNGFYIALASNVQEGVLITNKTRRKATSSSWGEKVVIKHGSTYHQFISSYKNGLSVDGLKDASMVQIGTSIKRIRTSKTLKLTLFVLMFSTSLHLESKASCSPKEWERART